MKEYALGLSKEEKDVGEFTLKKQRQNYEEIRN